MKTKIIKSVCDYTITGQVTLKDLTEQERQTYRSNYPHVAPEIVNGGYQSYQTDVYSYGYLFCSTLKYLRKHLDQLGDHKNNILNLGKKLTSPYSEKRISFNAVLSSLETIKP